LGTVRDSLSQLGTVRDNWDSICSQFKPEIKKATQNTKNKNAKRSGVDLSEKLFCESYRTCVLNYFF
jgi:hypothetical protein